MLSLAASLSTFAQNGGQSNENNSVKIEFGGFTQNGYSIIKVLNKQSCVADIQTKANGVTTIKSYQPNSMDTVHLMLTGTNAKVQSKTTTNCGGADFGQVELNLNIVALPVTFKYFKVRLRYE